MANKPGNEYTKHEYIKAECNKSDCIHHSTGIFSARWGHTYGTVLQPCIACIHFNKIDLYVKKEETDG